MASDLATALLSGQNAGSLAADPALLAITPQLQLAQALSTQGMSTAPAAPAQAIGRLAQALAGAKINVDAQEDFAKANAGATGEMSKIFPEGTPIGDGLRSQSGLVRMLAMQQAGKAMLLNSESKTLGPEQTAVAPATPRFGGGVVAAGSPAQAGAVEAAKVPAAVNRTAAEAAAKAPFEAGGDITVSTPRGRETVQVTAREREMISRGIWPDRFKAIGATGIVPAVPGASERGPQGESAPIVPKPVATVSANAPIRPQASFDQRFGDFSDVGGQPVKTPEFQGDVTAREKLFGGASEALGKAIGEHIEAGGKAARDKLGALDTMESALRTNGGKGIVTGPTAESALKMKQFLDSLGVDASWVKQGLPESEIVGKMNAQLASASAKAMTGRPTQIEFLAWQRNNPGLMTSKEGSLALMSVLRQQTQNDIELGKLAQNKKNWENWPETVDKFYETHGLTNPLTGKPMREELAAAHATPGAAGTPRASAAAAAPPVAGAKQAPDGNWYVPDPARAGKFLRVE